MMYCKEFSTGREILPQILNEITEIVTMYFKDPIIINRLEIAVEEILVNIFDYSGSDKVYVSCGYLECENALRMEFVDEGELYNPIEKDTDVDINDEIDDRQIGGLGVFLYTTIMDEMAYNSDDGKNHLIAVKKLQ